jgi:hypothetical protein
LEAHVRPILELLKPCVEDEATLDDRALTRALKKAAKNVPLAAMTLGKGWARIEQ